MSPFRIIFTWIAISVMVLAGKSPTKSGLVQSSVLPDLAYDLVYVENGTYYLLNTTTWQAEVLPVNFDIVPQSLSPDAERFVITQNQEFCLASRALELSECLETPWSSGYTFVYWQPDSQQFWFDIIASDVLWKVDATTGMITTSIDATTLLTNNNSGFFPNLSHVMASQGIAAYSYIDYGDPAIIAIYIVDLNSGNILQTITTLDEVGAVISPNGALLANEVQCITGNCGDNIAIYQWATNQISQIPIVVGDKYYFADGAFYWSSNSDQLAFIGLSSDGAKTMLYDLTTDEFQILAQSNPVGTAGSDLAWSPDDNAIAQNICVGNSCELAIILPANQQKITLVGFSDATDAQIVFWVPKNWLPDSAHLAPSAP